MPTEAEARKFAEQIYGHVMLHGGKGNPLQSISMAWFAEIAAPRIVELWQEAALSRSAGTRDEPGFDEATESRWQKAIYEVCKEAVGPEHYSEIDGAGCDSGDALDFTLTEIRQALDFVRENSRSAPGRETLKESLRETLAELKWILRYGSAQRIEPPQATQQVIAEAEKVLAESPSESAPAPEGANGWIEKCADEMCLLIDAKPELYRDSFIQLISRHAKLPYPEGRDDLREALAKALWDSEIDEALFKGDLLIKKASEAAQWPEDSKIQPYCRSTYRQADFILAALHGKAKLPAPEGMGRDVTASYQCGQRERDAKILAESNQELLGALRGMLELEKYTHRLPSTINAEWVAGITGDAKEAVRKAGEPSTTLGSERK